ncbi:type II secretion system protein [Sulfurimonas marina]|uniref:Type II secretion system protein n=1 Tax=Sulfurimonas marina TaxID=2590551 RepID=A0A7M3V9E6_9BACT|nr:type II secretion system protein [Sulfurimonas marina]QOP40379.1 type II secretion system protein [Sulfurimonas marina]
MIIIVGILSAVALPTFLSVSKQAKETVINGFVGTLNRTVGPVKWNVSVEDGKEGSVKDGTYNITSADIIFPSSFSTFIVDLTKCVDANATSSTQFPSNAARTTDNKYEIICRDGDKSTAPRFWYWEYGSKVTPTVADVNDSIIKY